MTDGNQRTLVNSLGSCATDSTTEAKLPDVIGWPLDEARQTLEAALAEQHCVWPLRVVQTAPPPPREPRAERVSKRKRPVSADTAVSRQTPSLGSWRVLRCRIMQSTLENIEPESSPVVELVVAREIVASDVVSGAPSLSLADSVAPDFVAPNLI